MSDEENSDDIFRGHWNQLLTEDQACDFVRAFEPRCYGQWDFDGNDDIRAIKIAIPSWRGLMCHVSYKCYGHFGKDARNGEDHVGESIWIMYTGWRMESLLGFLKNVLDEDNCKKIKDYWESAEYHKLTFRFTCAEDGRVFEGCD